MLSKNCSLRNKFYPFLRFGSYSNKTSLLTCQRNKCSLAELLAELGR